MFKHPHHSGSDAATTFETMKRATPHHTSPYSLSVAALSRLHTLIGREVPITAPYLDEQHIDNDATTSMMLPTIRTVTMPTERVERRA